MDFEVIAISSQKDKDRTYQLWESVLGDIWPVEKQNFDDVVFNQNSKNFIIKNVSEVIGHLSVQINGETAAFVSILVERIHQRKGMGTTLIDVATEELKKKGMKRISLGSGGYSYFWPGIPNNLSSAIKFFEKLGWKYSETSVDMTIKLKEYKTPSGIFERTNSLGITFELANKEQIKDILDFERKNFPNWYKYFSSTVGKNKLNDILIAKSSRNKILGSVLIDRDKKVWTCLLGNKIGALGALGVSENARGQGVGLALAAKGTEILKASEVDVCYLRWTWLVDWYGKLGYKVWREYQMSTINF
ncbi:hypothetical protein A2415_00270 [candidate division WWE3 bacterium RIFOXYC1_FULL_39_7]|uniref:N-acetyltransferase domain-containing protein n=1 Tax=candidate division WWE3 bacterium RIFOXYC1_FULL_39_7 TaxID=1802643 RepID=A0A1F4WG78_UNCKA|nr:MAG: hypothetical protein A2415_00270 [candidate division WWE3 bacterium RIFOXYC1_FULL_39_7]